MLYSSVRIEAHDEVVAGSMFGLVLCTWLGQHEDAPVGDAADNATAREDYIAGGFGDSVKLNVSRGKVVGHEGRRTL